MAKNVDTAKVDALVIGGGIVGAATAYYLAQSGVQVALLEKGRIGGEQSSRNWGSVCKHGRHPAEIPLMLKSIDLWRTLEEELQADLSWRQNGHLRIAYKRETMAMMENFIPTAKQFGLDTQLLGAREISRLLPRYHAGRDCLGGMFTPSDGCAEPAQVAAAFAHAAQKKGAQVLTNCAVLRLETTAGEMSGVHSEHGEWRAKIIVCAAGAWTAQLLRPLGLGYPSLCIRADVGHAAPPGVAGRQMVVWGKSAHRFRPDGSITLAASEDGVHDITPDSFRHGLHFIRLGLRNRHLLRFAAGKRMWRGIFSNDTHPRTAARELSPPPDPKMLATAARNFRQEYPQSGEIKFIKTWAGFIDYTPDALPVLASPAAPRGLVVAAGFCGNGFGMAPAAGNLAAMLAQGKQPHHDLSPFHLLRF